MHFTTKKTESYFVSFIKKISKHKIFERIVFLDKSIIAVGQFAVLEFYTDIFKAYSGRTLRLTEAVEYNICRKEYILVEDLLSVFSKFPEKFWSKTKKVPRSGVLNGTKSHAKSSSSFNVTSKCENLMLFGGVLFKNGELVGAFDADLGVRIFGLPGVLTQFSSSATTLESISSATHEKDYYKKQIVLGLRTKTAKDNYFLYDIEFTALV